MAATYGTQDPKGGEIGSKSREEIQCRERGSEKSKPSEPEATSPAGQASRMCDPRESSAGETSIKAKAVAGELQGKRGHSGDGKETRRYLGPSEGDEGRERAAGHKMSATMNTQALQLRVLVRSSEGYHLVHPNTSCPSQGLLSVPTLIWRPQRQPCEDGNPTEGHPRFARTPK